MALPGLRLPRRNRMRRVRRPGKFTLVAPVSSVWYRRTVDGNEVYSMSRIHGRYPCDWVLDFSMPRIDVTAMGSLNLHYVTGAPEFILSMDVTGPMVQELVNRERAYDMSIEWLNSGMLRVRGVRLTKEEAEQIAVNKMSPYDVLFPVWPECGYRLHAVPVDLITVQT